MLHDGTTDPALPAVYRSLSMIFGRTFPNSNPNSAHVHPDC